MIPMRAKSIVATSAVWQLQIVQPVVPLAISLIVSPSVNSKPIDATISSAL